MGEGWVVLRERKDCHGGVLITNGWSGFVSKFFYYCLLFRNEVREEEWDLIRGVKRSWGVKNEQTIMN